MTQFVRFVERSPRSSGSRNANVSPLQVNAHVPVGSVHPAALTAMQQTGEMERQKGRGSQRFLQGGLSAPITVTWEITAACNIACVHCLSSSGRRRPRELTTE